MARSVQFVAEAFLELFGLIWLTFAFTLVPIGVGVWILPGAIDFASANADRSRGLARRLAGVSVDAYRRPITGAPGPGQARYTWQRLHDPVVQRDLLWNVLNPVVGIALGLVPSGLVLSGVWDLAATPFQIAFPSFQAATASTLADRLEAPVAAQIVVSLVVALAEIVIGVAAARPVLRAQGLWGRHVLNVDDSAQWRRRAVLLEATRADAIDLQQAEVTRIERDLHDGAQMRFVATGLTIDEAARLIPDDPDRAIELLAQAKDESVEGLAELRRLVRGIRPPVLADRGLVDAIRALAADMIIPTTVVARLSGRLAAPLESALYFAAAEGLTNVAKHSQANAVEVVLDETEDVTRIVITDDGCGGARVNAGHGGLTGIARRLRTFDATLDIASPVGGPTVLTVIAPRIPVVSTTSEPSR